RLSRFTSPGAELISIGGIDRLMDASRRLRRIEPVATGVVENSVQDAAHAPLMSLSHQPCQIFPAAESRIDIQKVLHPIAMIAALVGSLAEDGAQPQCSDPRLFRYPSFDRTPLRLPPCQREEPDSAQSCQLQGIPLVSGLAAGS